VRHSQRTARIIARHSHHLKKCKVGKLAVVTYYSLSEGLQLKMDLFIVRLAWLFQATIGGDCCLEVCLKKVYK